MFQVINRIREFKSKIWFLQFLLSWCFITIPPSRGFDSYIRLTGLKVPAETRTEKRFDQNWKSYSLSLRELFEAGNQLATKPAFFLTSMKQKKNKKI